MINNSEKNMTTAEAMQLALRHHQKGELAEAEALYRRVVGAEPNNADAFHLLGIIAQQVGNYEAAIELIREAVRLKDKEPLFLNNLGIAYHALNKLPEAEACYRHVLSLSPGDHMTHFNLGNALKQQGKTEEAIACYRRALSIKPDDPAALNNLGNALKDQGNAEEAVACYRRALSFNPDNYEALYNLGNTLEELGQTVEAIACYRRVLSLKPDYNAALINLGNALKEQGNMEEAIACYRSVLSRRPDHHETVYNLGNAYKDQGNMEEAIACYKNALSLRPDYYRTHYNLGNVFLALGKVEEALGCYRRALSINPAYSEAYNSLLCAQQYLPGIDAHTLRRAHEIFEKNYAFKVTGCSQPYRNNRDPDRPLRIGFVSPDLRRHPVSYFLVRLLENLDPDGMETVFYSNSLVEDEMTGRIKAKAMLWRNITVLSDDASSQRIREDGIDVLFDLSGHTAGNRLPVFARKPAPVQISWIGYASTTGLSAMDYIMSDNICIPEGEEGEYTERVIRLPNSFLCYDPPCNAAGVEPLPALSNGFVAFGCFNNLAKINGEVVRVWGEILRGLPGARLVLKSKLFHHESMRRTYAVSLESNGIDSRRVDLLPSSSHGDYLASYNKIDIALDPFPFSGGTTTCEALWMGVPVVTLYGRTALGRQGASLNTHLGLSRLTAKTEDDYRDIAIRLADDLEGLSELRNCMRGMMEKSPLCDGGSFASDWIHAVRGVWRTWCETQA